MHKSFTSRFAQLLRANNKCKNNPVVLSEYEGSQGCPNPMGSFGLHPQDDATGHVEQSETSQSRHNRLRFFGLRPQNDVIYNNEKNLFTHSLSHLFTSSRAAFTLAEVLITLGIIGVIAAITIPTLIKRHQQQIVISRMKNFYSTFNQALKLSIVDNGDMKDWTYPTDYYDQDGSYVFWNTYLKPHMKYLKEVKNFHTLWPTSGVLVYLPDGSAFCLSGSWVTFYPNAQKRTAKQVSRDIFLFYISSSKSALAAFSYGTSRDDLKKNCKETLTFPANTRSCAALIMYDGWKISDDYPW